MVTQKNYINKMALKGHCDRDFVTILVKLDKMRFLAKTLRSNTRLVLEYRDENKKYHAKKKSYSFDRVFGVTRRNLDKMGCKPFPS